MTVHKLCKYFPLGSTISHFTRFDRSTFPLCTDWKNSHRLSWRRTSLSIMGARLWAPFKPHQYDRAVMIPRGFRYPKIGPPWYQNTLVSDVWSLLFFQYIIIVIAVMWFYPVVEVEPQSRLSFVWEPVDSGCACTGGRVLRFASILCDWKNCFRVP